MTIQAKRKSAKIHQAVMDAMRSTGRRNGDNPGEWDDIYAGLWSFAKGMLRGVKSDSFSADEVCEEIVRRWGDDKFSFLIGLDRAVLRDT